MSIKTFLWIEDRKGKSSYKFWKCLMGELYPDVIVESKKNNSELVKAVKALKDINNKYIIVFDNSFDNFQVVKEQRVLKEYVSKTQNVALLDIICFEYVLLEFEDLIKWIYAPDDEFLEKRASAIIAREKLINAILSNKSTYKDIKEIIAYNKNINNYNIEQLAAKLLFDLTRNTGFEVSKAKIGDCWIKSCCEWKQRMEDDICGLDNSKLHIYDKMKRIYDGTSLREKFKSIEMERDYDNNIQK